MPEKHLPVYFFSSLHLELFFPSSGLLLLSHIRQWSNDYIKEWGHYGKQDTDTLAWMFSLLLRCVSHLCPSGSLRTNVGAGNPADPPQQLLPWVHTHCMMWQQWMLIISAPLAVTFCDDSWCLCKSDPRHVLWTAQTGTEAVWISGVRTCASVLVHFLLMLLLCVFPLMPYLVSGAHARAHVHFERSSARRDELCLRVALPSCANHNSHLEDRFVSHSKNICNGQQTF